MELVKILGARARADCVSVGDYLVETVDERIVCSAYAATVAVDHFACKRNLALACWLKIDAMDRNYLISDIVTIIAQYKASLTGINSEVLPDKVNVTIDIKVKVRDSEQLRVIMANIRKLDSVVDVERVIK